jgi:ParB family chromosome partitioning protein
MITDILLEQKKPECWNMVIPMNKITKYFPKSYTPKDMEEIIIDLLGKWARDL